MVSFMEDGTRILKQRFHCIFLGMCMFHRMVEREKEGRVLNFIAKEISVYNDLPGTVVYRMCVGCR